MPLQSTDNKIHPISQAIAIAADEHQSAVGDERCQLTLECCPVLTRDLEYANQLAGGRRVMHLLTHLAQQLIAGGHDRIVRCIGAREIRTKAKNKKRKSKTNTNGRRDD